LALGDAHQRGRTRTDDEDVVKSGGELVTSGILQVNDVVRTRVLLASLNDTNSTKIVTTNDHGKVSNIEGNMSNDAVALQGELDGILNLDHGIGITDGATVMSDEVRDGVLAHGNILNLAELELGLLLRDAVDVEATLGIVQETEVLAGLGDAHDVHETDGESGIGSNLVVDSDKALSGNKENLTSGKSVLETVSQENDHGDALAGLVGTRGWLRGPHSGEFVQHPVVGSIKSLQMLLRSTRSTRNLDLT